MSKLMHRIQDALSQMSARERRMVIGGAIVMLLSIIGGGVWGAASHMSDLEQAVSDRENSLRQMQIMALEHGENLEKTNKIKKILEDSRNTTMQSFVEKKAAEVGIQRDRLDAIKSKPPTMQAGLEETAVTVQVSKLSLDDAMNFIHVLEVADFPMVIRNANFKTSKRSGEKVIRLTLEIAAYRTVAVAGGE